MVRNPWAPWAPCIPGNNYMKDYYQTVIREQGVPKPCNKNQDGGGGGGTCECLLKLAVSIKFG